MRVLGYTVIVALGVLLALGISALMALPIMWLWNYIAADLLRLPRLDFWHAWSLSVLCSLLFKSWHYGQKGGK